MSEQAKPKRHSIVETITPLLEPVTAAQGVELYDLEYVKEGGDRILRLYIDKDGGVGIQDCERVSHAAEAVLDAHDPIPDAYILEVSSPGIERRLRKDSHFERYAGDQVELRLFTPVDGKKKIRGVLKGLRDGSIVIFGKDGEEICFDKRQVSYCRLSVFE